MQLLSECGPFFAIALHADPLAMPWRPVADLAGSAELVEWIGRVQAGLHSDRRVAASVVQLGLAARLVSPVLAAAVRHGVLLDLGTGYWQPPLTSTVALSLAAPAGGSTGAVSSQALARVVSQGPVAELTAALGRLGSVSPRVLAGNIASAVNGAALQLGPDSFAAAAGMLAGLAGEDGRPGPGFRRRSCCLRYRAGDLGYCGDCVLG
jgi:hypothetical protein